MEIATYCRQCGAAIVPSMALCVNCGAPVSTPGSWPGAPSRDTGTRNEAHNPFTCPCCLQLDQVAKVSSVVRSGISHGETVSVSNGQIQQSGSSLGWFHWFDSYTRPGSDGFHVSVFRSRGKIHATTNATTQTRSAVSQLLSEPLAPTYRSAWSRDIIFAVFALFLFAFIGFGSVVTGTSPHPVLPFVLAAAGIAITAWARKETRQRQNRFAAERLRWEHAKRNWDNLLMCSRCDSVFYPDQRALYPISSVMDVVYADNLYGSP